MPNMLTLLPGIRLADQPEANTLTVEIDQDQPPACAALICWLNPPTGTTMKTTMTKM